MDRIDQGARRLQGASLSVVLLSDGDCGALERALSCIASPCRRLDAEIVVVRARCEDKSFSLDAAYPSVLFVEVPSTSTLSERREIGISRAAGDIVAVKIDGDVGDSGWLSAFERVVGASDDLSFLDREGTASAVAVDTAERRRPRHARAGFPGTGARRERAPRDAGAAEGLHGHASGDLNVARVREM